MSEGQVRAEHTPGPWYVGVQNDILYIIDRAPRPSNDDINPNVDITPIARMLLPREASFDVEYANALLMAAAPDLLKALEAMLSSPRFGNEPSEEAIEMARAAIAKARNG